jgi:hypothetical protein
MASVLGGMISVKKKPGIEPGKVGISYSGSHLIKGLRVGFTHRIKAIIFHAQFFQYRQNLIVIARLQSLRQSRQYAIAIYQLPGATLH